MRYGYDLGCRFGLPHNMMILGETPHAKWEVCLLCGVKKKYNKGYKGRVDNQEYLKDHVRNFAQKSGATRRIYHKIYKPEKTTIII